ncbi:hypothetical protein PTRA_a1869 [Pseudoalteromonas translucida KMM 520]|uniref:Uncharacterized protein n=1 Tax=Pseudoalteromonas translucida KMM 520 TaxID=1315283 RepID=A0A0U2WIC3_9GAMM|nr:hypothetical protein PTRA_a1869 [Pseudoalteromonas translucida KMM 520]
MFLFNKVNKIYCSFTYSSSSIADLFSSVTELNTTIKI